jgi:hypothetical protein
MNKSSPDAPRERKRPATSRINVARMAVAERRSERFMGKNCLGAGLLASPAVGARILPITG